MAEDVVDRDTKDFQFRQLCKFRVSSSPTALPKQRFSLLAVSSAFGLTFIGNGTGFSVYRNQHFLDKDKEHSIDRLNHIVTDCPSLARVDVGQEVSHVALSCDDFTIAIATTSQLGVTIHLYDIRNFAQKVTGNVSPFHSFTEVVPGPIRDLAWNPGEAATLAVVHSNGQIDVFTDMRRRASLSSAKANCMSWSPKGRQLVVGRKDGALMQYDADLNEKRKWDKPPKLTQDGLEAINIVWLSTYSFIVAFAPPSLDGTQPCVIQINGSKEGPIQYSIFEDICFGTGEDREAKYHFIFMSPWNLVVATSNNSTEVGVVGQHLDGSSWERWSLDDSHRAECPLTDEYADTYPVGFAVDYSSHEQIPLEDDKFHRAEPILLLLTTDGLLIPYHMLYLHTNAQAITSPPRPLTAEGLRLSAGPQSAPIKPPAVGNQSTVAVTGAGIQLIFGAGSTPGLSIGAGSQSLFGPAKPPLFGAGNQPVASPAQPPIFGVLNQSKPASGTLPGFGVTNQASSTASGFPVVESAGLTNRSGASAAFSFNPSNASTPVAQPGLTNTNLLLGTGSAALKIPTTTSSGTTGSAFGTAGSASAFPSTQPATTLSFGSFAARFDNDAGKASGGANSFSFMPSAPQGTSGGFGGNTASGAHVSSGQSGTMASLLNPPVSGASRGVSHQRDAPLDEPRSPTEAPPPPYPSGRASPQSPRYSPTQGQTDLTPGATDQVEMQFSQTIRDEIQHFEREMAELRARAAGVDVRVGSREEMTQLRAQTQDMQAFSDEIRRTVQDQSQEVQGERSLCLDLFSQVEECRRRRQLNTDPKYLHLLKTCALDPGSAERLRHLQQQYQLLDQGLRDVDLILDTQWEEYQNRKKNKTAMPTNDALYRVVKSNHNLITAQKVKLRQLEERLKQLKLYNQTSSWSNTSIATNNDVSELSNLADTLLSGSPIKSSSSHCSVKEERKVSRNKMEKLREHLMSRNVPTVRSTKPGNLSVLTIPDHQLGTGRSTTDGANGATYGDTARSGAGEFVRMFERDVDVMAQRKPPKDNSKSQSKNQPVTSQSNKGGDPKGFFQGILDKGKKVMEKGQQLIMPKDPATSKPGQMKPAIPAVTIGQALQPKPEAKNGQPLSGTLKGQPPSVPPFSAPQLGHTMTRIPKNQPQFEAPKKQPPAVAPKPGSQFGVQQIQTLGGGAKLPPSGLASGDSGMPLQVTKVKRLNDIEFEDVTPSGSENDAVETSSEDDEYDEEEDSSEGNGFGAQYKLTGDSVVTSSTPKFPVLAPAGVQDSPKLPPSGTPVSRKLFGSDTTTAPTSFEFSASSGDSTSKPVTKPASSFPSVTMTTPGSQTGFNFGASETVLFGGIKGNQTATTGAAKAAAGTASKTGVIVDPAAVSTSLAAVTSAATSHKSVFGQSSSTGQKTIFGQPLPATTAATTLPSNQSLIKHSVIGQPSDAYDTTGEPETESDDQNAAVASSVPTSGAGAGLFGKQTTTAASLFGQPAPATTPGIFSFGSTSTPAGSFGLISTSGVTASSASTFSFGNSSTPAGSFTFGSASGTGARSSPAGAMFGSASSTSSGGITGLFGKPKDSTASTTTAVTQPSSTTAQSSVAKTTASSANPDTSAKSSMTSTSTTAQAAVTTSAVGLFGKPSSGSTESVDQRTSATSAATSTGMVSASITSSLGPAASSGEIFGQPATVPGGLLGQPTTTTSGGLFGQPTTTTNSGGLFGQPTTTTNSGGLFGQPTTTTNSGGFFGQPATVNSGGLFGQPATINSGGLFGEPATTTSGGLFGQPATTNSGGLFGQSTTTTNSGGLFGQPSTANSGGLFGQPATTTSGGLFGQTVTSGGIFGQPAAPSSGGLFGQTSTPSSGGLFGQPATTSSGGLFGQPTTTSSGGLFGKPASSSTGGLFGQQSSSGSGLFGASSSSGSGFGFGTSSAAPAFGQSATFGQASSGSVFGQSGDSSGGGGLFSGLGGKPSADKAGTNVFGSTTFGGATSSPGSGLFGSSTGPTTFGNSGGPFSGGGTTGGFGAFSTGGAGVAATGFGAVGAQQPAVGGFVSAPAFGSSPAFGGTPAFGSAPKFGSPPAFGGGATQTGFGSAPVFGSASSAGGIFGGGTSGVGTAGSGFAGFGQVASPTFGALAQASDVPSFGGLSQSPSSGFGGSGNTFGGSPSFSGYRG
ncbi:nuclear pore complex protein Nup214-like isoform X3 [Dreissena polymorpha]|uniref:nuclear pore complex protein Nup214-like isoform X3 n=1 Tax=Dreissena polymorpha TaxID=45954 RepID=UPI002263BE02|nr:nuclear pore complex protein Nup214-like isoform X3 [Dreissena polymorpha]